MKNYLKILLFYFTLNLLFFSAPHLPVFAESNQIISPEPGKAYFNGTFIAFGPYSDLPQSQIASFLDELVSLNMNTLIVQNTRFCTGQSNGVNQYAWQSSELPGKLGVLLDEAQSRNMEVYIGLTQSDGRCNWLEGYFGDLDYIVNYILSNYDSKSSFKGWYLPAEPWPVPPVPEMFRDLVDGIRQYDLKARPILTTPILSAVSAGKTSQDEITPQMVADVAKQLQNLGIDIQVWQDGIGVPPSIDPGWWGETYTLKDYYSAIKNVIGASFWSDNEIFNSLSFASVPIARVKKQLEVSDIATRRISYINQANMTSVINDSYTVKGAKRVLASYKTLMGVGENFKPLSYKWFTTPSDIYPDSGNKMFDLITGNPQEYTSVNGWVGIQGSAKLEVDLGSVKQVDWVSVHSLHFPEAGIYLPLKLIINCSTNGSDWTNKGSWDPEPLDMWYYNNEPKRKGDAVLGNYDRLQTPCRYIQIELTNTKPWTFISEIEITGEGDTGNTPTPLSTPTILGDINNDGVVNIQDFVLLSNAFGTNNSSADINSDGIINIQDFVVLSNNFGKTLPTPTPITPSTSVPTPTISPNESVYSWSDQEYSIQTDTSGYNWAIPQHDRAWNVPEDIVVTQIDLKVYPQTGKTFHPLFWLDAGIGIDRQNNPDTSYPAMTGGFSELMAFHATRNLSSNPWNHSVNIRSTPLFVPKGSNLLCTSSAGGVGISGTNHTNIRFDCTVYYMSYAAGQKTYRIARFPFADQSVDPKINNIPQSYYISSSEYPIRVAGYSTFLSFGGDSTPATANPCLRKIKQGGTELAISCNGLQQLTSSSDYETPDFVPLNWDLSPTQNDLLVADCPTSRTNMDCGVYALIEIPSHLPPNPESVFRDYGHVDSQSLQNYCTAQASALTHPYYCNLNPPCADSLKTANCLALFPKADCVSQGTCGQTPNSSTPTSTPVSCGANASYLNGSCQCLSSWGNCNSNWSDGCETSLTTKSNCGVCGRTCGRNERCQRGQCEYVDPYL